MPKHSQFVSLQIRSRAGHRGEAVVRVLAGHRISGKVLAAAEDAAATERVVELTRQRDHLSHAPPVAAAAERVRCLVVEGDIEHGAEIEVEPEEPQQAGGQVAVPPHEGRVALVAELLCVWGLLADQPEPRHAAPFLIDGDHGLHRGEVAEVVDQPPHLLGRRDVATEENEAARLYPPQHRCRVGVERRPRNADEQQLTEIACHESTSRGRRLAVLMKPNLMPPAFGPHGRRAGSTRWQ